MTSARSLRWGLTFIAFGVFWLLIEKGVIASEVFVYALALWPILLIAIGIEMIFKRTQLKALAFISPLLLGLTLTLIGVEAYNLEQGESTAYHSSFNRNLDTGVETLHASVELGNYDLYVRARTGERIRGKMVGSHPGTNLVFTQSGTTADLEVTDSDRWFNWGSHGIPLLFTSHGFGSNRDPEFRLDVPAQTTLDLTLSGSDSFAELNMTHASLRKLIANLEEVQLKIKVGDNEPLVDVTLSGKDNKLVLLFPNGGGVRLDGNGITSDLSGYLSGQGLVQDGEAFVSPGFDTLTPQVRVSVTDDLQSLRIETYDIQ